MTAQAVMTVVGFAANALLAFFVLSRDAKAAANRLYAAFTFLVAFWAVIKFVQTFSPDAAEAAFWYRLSGIGWLPMPAVYLHFVGAFTRRALFGAWTGRALGVIYAVAAALFVAAWFDGLILERMAPSIWGWVHEPGPVYKLVFMPYLLLLFAYGLGHLIAFTARASLPDDRTRGLLLICGIAVPLVGGVVTNMILPAMGMHVPGMAIPLTTITAVLVAYAVVRYRLLSITVEYAASTIIRTMPDSLMVLDRSGVVTLVNPATMTLTGYEGQDLIGGKIDDLCHARFFGDDLRAKLEAEGVAKTEVSFVSKNRTLVPVSLSVSPLTDRRGATVGYVCVAKDIRDIKQLIARIEEAKEDLERIAVTDSLTGVFNRRYLGARLREEFLRSLRYSSPFTVVVADLDRFKEINDALGHSAGDQLLREVGATFMREMRSSDVVTRYGGDEFVLILPEAPDARAVEVVARVKAAIERLEIPGSELRISVSFGIATFDPAAPVEDEEVLLRRADEALYESKSLGRSRVTVSGSR